jgi:aldose 1-epimerase
MPWAAVHHGAEAVLLRTPVLGRAGYPFCLEMDAEYQLSEEHGLRVSITARNTGSRPAPYGTGSHPYLNAGLPTVDECTLSLPAARWLPADARGIPAGEARTTGTDADFAPPYRSGTPDHASHRALL